MNGKMTLFDWRYTLKGLNYRFVKTMYPLDFRSWLVVFGGFAVWEWHAKKRTIFATVSIAAKC